MVRALADGNGRRLEDLRVEDVASGEVQTVSPDEPLERAVEEMRRHSVRRPARRRRGRAVGILSLGDLAIERDARSALATISAASPNR